MFLRGANFQGNAAAVGIVCHNTFEDFVRAVFIRKDTAWDEAIFWKMFYEHSDAVLGANRSSPEAVDAHDLASRWFNTKNRFEMLNDVQVLSVESKSNFMLRTSAGEIPVNYIMDRLERVAPGEYRVVDYKSNRVGLSHNQLRNKLQARLYALMVQIAYKDAERIWVQFEFLRHGQVEVLFTRDDNIKMYRELQRRAEDIIATDEEKAPEVLNSDCSWCVRKASCKKLQSHINVGGVMSKSVDELSELHHKIESQKKGQQALLDEIEKQLMAYAIAEDLLEFETDYGTVTVTAPVKRAVNNEAAGAVLRAAGLATEYERFSVTDLDKIIKQKLLSPQEIEILKLAIKKNVGDPKIKIDHSGY